MDRNDDVVRPLSTFTEIGRYAYDSLIYQQVIVPFVLILFRQYRMAQLVVLILITSLILTHLIALFIPAISSYPFYEIHPSQHAHIRLSQENVFVPHVQAFRSGATVDLDLPPWFAVTTFPSLHSTMALFSHGHCAQPPMSGGQVSSPTPRCWRSRRCTAVTISWMCSPAWRSHSSRSLHHNGS